MDNMQIPNLQALSNSLNMDILEHGHLCADKNWQYNNVISPFNRLYFVLNGEGTIKNNSHQIVLKKGYIYLIPCHTTYDYQCENFLEKFYIHFNLEYIGGHDLFDPYPSCKVCKIDEATLNQLIAYATNDDIMGVLKFKTSLMHLITLFHDPCFDIASSSITSILKYKDVLEFIKDNCFAYTTTKDMANYANTNIHTFSKNFKKDFGVTPKQHLTQKLIAKAKQNLLCTTLNIKDIAYRIGFSDEFYFSRFFKKHTGVSPSEYRLSNSLL